MGCRGTVEEKLKLFASLGDPSTDGTFVRNVPLPVGVSIPDRVEARLRGPTAGVAASQASRTLTLRYSRRLPGPSMIAASRSSIGHGQDPEVSE
jgi:hypothetical protein